MRPPRLLSSPSAVSPPTPTPAKRRRQLRPMKSPPVSKNNSTDSNHLGISDEKLLSVGAILLLCDQGWLTQRLLH